MGYLEEKLMKVFNGKKGYWLPPISAVEG